MLLHGGIRCSKEEELILRFVSSSFSNLNSIAILRKDEVKISHFLGKSGIKEVIYTDELDQLSDSLLRKCETKITLGRFLIKSEDFSHLMQKTLQFIESNYLNIYSLTEVANEVGVTENTIDREFQKHSICSPKRLLMYFKVMHSVDLLIKTDFKIKEIAAISGFTNEQRFIECFKRIFNISPSEYRKYQCCSDQFNNSSQKSVINVK